MANETETQQPGPTEAEQARIDEARSVTITDFTDFLNEVVPDAKCLFCGADEFMVLGQPDSDQPLITSMTIPKQKYRGVWSYPVVCRNCGLTLLFNTAHVSDAVHKEKN
ncbi:TPA: hypothetical protein N2A36_005520 [Pseudomonas aeruginosa]|nr:hypothetical protein [Pseudomonas aeruginosa]